MTTDLERRLQVVEAILDIDDVNSTCLGDPNLCGDSCTKDRCPLLVNQVHALGEAFKGIQGALEWWKALAEELDKVPPGIHKRATIRAVLNQQKKTVQEMGGVLEAMALPQNLRDEFSGWLEKLREGVRLLEDELQEHIE